MIKIERQLMTAIVPVCAGQEQRAIRRSRRSSQRTLARSHWYNQDKTIETYVGQLFSDWTDNFSTEVKVSYRDYVSTPLNNSNLPQIRLNFARPLPAGSPAVANANAGLVFGTERSRHFNDLATETFNYYAAGNWFLGDHTVKFGFDYDDNEVFNASCRTPRQLQLRLPERCGPASTRIAARGAAQTATRSTARRTSRHPRELPSRPSPELSCRLAHRLRIAARRRQLGLPETWALFVQDRGGQQQHDDHRRHSR